MRTLAVCPFDRYVVTFVPRHSAAQDGAPPHGAPKPLFDWNGGVDRRAFAGELCPGPLARLLDWPFDRGRPVVVVPGGQRPLIGLSAIRAVVEPGKSKPRAAPATQRPELCAPALSNAN